ncbi:MAG: hypothetical protein ACK52I_01795 [Pseudomonadota bacterium]|jgi:hypothetical protein
MKPARLKWLVVDGALLVMSTHHVFDAAKRSATKLGARVTRGRANNGDQLTGLVVIVWDPKAEAKGGAR